MIYKPDDDTRIVFDEETRTSKIYSLRDVQNSIDRLIDTTNGKDLVTDAELLEWAKINYPNSQEVQQRTDDLTELNRLNNLLESLK